MADVTVVWSKGWLLTGAVSKSYRSLKDPQLPDEVLIAWGNDLYNVLLLTGFPDLKYAIDLKDDDFENVAQELLDDILDSLENQR